MFERFTDRARRVIVRSQEEARRLRHDYIGTEHLLIAVFHEAENDTESPTALLLVQRGIAPAEAIARVGLTPGPEQPADAHIPFTKSAKSALEGSLRELIALGGTDITPAHLLLGIIRAEADTPESVTGTALNALGIRADSLRLLLGARIGMSSAFHKTVSYASLEARRLDRPLVGNEHLLLGILATDPELAAQIFGPLGVTADQITERVLAVIAERT
ncbi:Clp protease N-terminal domain-containing protein [Nocardia sp. NPDC052566]|uniref:Clp protease N-terminal domain-containing protein n=1 Tax=Nocardia sp. NPDC052566 TaxID=3364330 RepID=UPI0037CC6E10